MSDMSFAVGPSPSGDMMKASLGGSLWDGRDWKDPQTTKGVSQADSWEVCPTDTLVFNLDQRGTQVHNVKSVQHIPQRFQSLQSKLNPITSHFASMSIEKNDA